MSSPVPPQLEPAMLFVEQAHPLIGMSRSGFYRALSAGLVPDGIPTPGGKRKRWLKSDLLAWLEAGQPTAAEWARRKASARR